MVYNTHTIPKHRVGSIVKEYWIKANLKTSWDRLYLQLYSKKSVYVKTLFKSPTPFIFVGSNTLVSLFGALLIRYPTTLEFLTSWVLQCDSSFNLIVLCNGFSSRSPFRNTTDTCLDSAVQSIILTVGSMFAYLVIVFWNLMWQSSKKLYGGVAEHIWEVPTYFTYLSFIWMTRIYGMQ